MENDVKNKVVINVKDVSKGLASSMGVHFTKGDVNLSLPELLKVMNEVALFERERADFTRLIEGLNDTIINLRIKLDKYEYDTIKERKYYFNRYVDDVTGEVTFERKDYYNGEFRNLRMDYNLTDEEIDAYALKMAYEETVKEKANRAYELEQQQKQEQQEKKEKTNDN